MFKNHRVARFVITAVVVLAVSAISYAMPWSSFGSFSLFTPSEAATNASPDGTTAPENTNNKAMLGALSGTYNIPGDYADLAAAITDLNASGVSGPVVFNVVAGNPQTAPAGGYVIGGAGSLVLTTTSSTNTVTITGNANTVTANAALTSGQLHDSIFELVGADWITIQGFSMLENPANATTAAGTNNMTEFGVGLFYVTTTDGAQNNTIQNNTIDLNRTYQNTFGIYSTNMHNATTITTLAPTTTASGANSGTRIYTNTITDANMGIVIVGSSAVGTLDSNDGLDIGGTSVATGNTLTNIGTTGTFSGYNGVSGTVNGILVRNTRNFNISRNSITMSNGGVTVTGTINGIQIPVASTAPSSGTLTQTINNNSISVRGGNVANVLNGINMPSGSVNATTTVNMNNNDFNTFGHTVAGGTGAITFISHGGNPLTQTMNGNTFTNINVNTTGTITFFSFAPSLISGASLSISNNSIVTGFTRTGVGSTTVWSSNASSVNGSSHTMSNNNFSNFTLTGASAFTGFSNTDGASASSGPVKTINGNTFSNITTGSGTVVPISVNFSGANSNVNNNTITSITTSNSITALTLGASNQATLTANGNTIGGINSAGAVVAGINVGAFAANLGKNKVYDLNGSVAGSIVSGVIISSATTSSTINLTNSLIGNLTTPAATSSNGIRGIDITGSATTSTFNVFHNTVYLNNPTSGAGFGSSGISTLASATSTTSALNMRNNIIVNTSVQNGAGLTVAYRRSLGTAGTLANYASSSNNNLFYAGTPSATNLIYADGTSTAQTIAAYKAGVFTAGTISPRDSASVTENPPFLSTVGANANFLHINPATPTQVESGAAFIATVTDDFDGDTRNASTPDIGADEGNFTFLDLAGPAITYTPLGNTSSTVNRTQAVTITDTTGVNTAPALSPRIYYSKNGGAYAGTLCTQTGGTPQNGTWDCIINYASVGGVVVGDQIQYFVIAQDTLGNVGANPNAGLVATDVNTIPTTPTNPVTYNIVTAVIGSFNVDGVGGGGNFASLTNPGGIFEFINNNEVTGNITINITADLTAETGTHPLNAFPGGFTVLIRPSGVARTISTTGTPASFLRFNGVSNLTIDGSLSAGTDRSLSILNGSASATSTLVMGSVGTTPITNNTVKNCIIRHGVNTSTSVIISDSTTVGNAGFFSNITIQNNDIQRALIGVFANGGTTPQNGSNVVYADNTLDASGANAIRNIGLYMQGVNGATVSNNAVGNFGATNDESDTGIWLALGTINAAVSGNTVSAIGYTGTGTVTPFGIRDSGSAAASGNVISRNNVSNITSNGTSTAGPTVFGIDNSSGGTIIERNNVQGVIAASTGTFGATGINISGGNNTVLRNNFVSNVTGDMTGGAAFSTTFGIFGMRIASGTGHQVYNNSVNLYGARTGTATTSLLTAAFAIVGTGSTGMDVRNNIFANNITGGTTSIANVAVYLPTGGTSAMNLTWNNNAYYWGTDVARAGSGQAGTTAGTNFFTTFDPTLTTPASNLRSYTSTLSVAGTNDNASVGATTAPPFISNNDLHLPVTATALINTGVTIGSVTNDFDGQIRPLETGYEIGADEVDFTAPTVTTTTPLQGATGVANNTNITLNFSEAVNIAAGGITVNCGGAQTFTPTLPQNNVTSIVLDPTNLLPFGTLCTVTAVAANVADVGSNLLDGDGNGTGGDNFVLTFTIGAPDYSITTTGSAIVVTDLSGNGDTVNITQPGPNLIRFTDAGGTRTFSVDGAAFVVGNSTDLSLTGINSVTFNGQAGTDTINVSAFSGLPSLTLNGGVGNDLVDFLGNITFATNASLDVNLQNDDLTPGTDQVNVSSGSDLILSGVGAAEFRVSRNILFTPGSILRTADGNIILESNLQTPASTGNFQGIDVAGTTIEATGTGVVLLHGRGGDGASNRGVYVRRLSSINSMVRGGNVAGITTSITGQGGVGSNPHGVDVDAGNAVNGAVISSFGGDVSVNGTAGNTGGANNYGVIPVNNGLITSGGNGNVVVQGTGGAGAGGGNVGVIVHQGTGTITSGGNGSVTVTGTGGPGGSSHGIQMFRTGRISSGGTGAVNVTGTGGGGNGHGVYINPIDGTELGRISSGGGPITVQGTASAGTAVGIILAGATAATQPHIISGGNATINLIADTMVLDGGGVSSINSGTGITNLRQLTNGRQISLGGGDIHGSQLGLGDGELDVVTAGTLNIGNANTGAVIVVAPITQTKTTNITTPVGVAINAAGDLGIFGSINGNTTMATSGVLRPGASPGVVNSVGNYAFNIGSVFAVELGGTSPGNGATNHDQLNVTGTVNVTNATLTTTNFGGFSPAVFDQFVIINNDGADAVTGTFLGMPQGFPIPNFAGNGLAGVIRYNGGDGNDVVIEARLAPTAANANIAGRIVTADGRGISSARVIVSAGILGQPRVALTNPFGYYSFTDLPAGQTYVVTVGSKSYTFAVPSRVITLNDSVDNADFIADPLQDQ